MDHSLRARAITFLRSTERYTRTDMVYLTKNGFWLNLGTITVSIFSLFLYIIFARTLSPETYGIYQYLLSAGAVIGAVTLTGMNSAVTRAVALGREGMFSKSMRTQFIWGLIPFFISVAIGIYYGIQGNAVLSLGFFLLGIFVPLNNTLNTYGAFLAGKKDFRRVFYYNFSTNVFFYGSLGLVALVIPSALILIAVNFVTQAIAAFIAYRATVRTYRPTEVTDDETLTYGKHLSLMGVIGAIAYQVDNLLVFQFLGAAPLAVYSFATAIPDRLGSLFKFIPTSLLPVLSEKNEGETLKALSWKNMMWVVASIGLLILMYTFAAPYVFKFLFPTYLAAVPFSQVYALAMVGVMGQIFSTALIAQKQMRSLYIFNTVVPIGQMLLQLVGIAFFGLWGLVLMKIASAWAVVALSAFLLFRQRES